MNFEILPAKHTSELRQVSLGNLVLGVLIKERAHLGLLFLYLLANSALIYWLSATVIEKETTGTYANPTTVLYFRLLVVSIPLIIGLLFGAPLLASEYESGTYRFIFTQGVGRRRFVAVIFCVYLASILLLSIMTIFSINHFLALEGTAQFFTIWSFAVFICQPILIIPLSLCAFIAGTFFGALMKRIVPGIAVTLLFGVLLALCLKMFFDWLIGGPVQGLYDSVRKSPHQRYDFYGHNDSRYLFEIQILFMSLLAVLTLALLFLSVRALDSKGLFHRRLKTSG